MVSPVLLQAVFWIALQQVPWGLHPPAGVQRYWNPNGRGHQVCHLRVSIDEVADPTDAIFVPYPEIRDISKSLATGEG